MDGGTDLAPLRPERNLVDARGRALDMSEYRITDRVEHRKADPPKLGNAFGQWAGKDLYYLRLPGGAVLQFDLNRLTLADYRAMRTHYQINTSLFVIMAMMHQLDWHIECENKQIGDQIELNMREVWTRFIRAVPGQAYWAGYSPCVLDFENDVDGKYIDLVRIKDLVPEDCRVHWEDVDGWAPPGHPAPKFKTYGGIYQTGMSYPIPPENTLWYPVLMENGDYYGRKLLKTAFPAWFFSMLIHLFANRYYERFGEPVPVGRAPFDDEVQFGDGTVVNGKTAMETILMNLRNRSVVVLPSDKGPDDKDYEYTIEYLESQMRGADFERYLSRLDEEMSLAVFTPTLLFRTADVGSYNLGVSHMQIFQWLSNLLAGDLCEYIEKYPVARLHDYNWTPKAPPAYFRWRAQGKDNTAILQAIVEYTLRGKLAEPDLVELGNAVGMTFKEVQQVLPASPTGLPPTSTSASPDNAGGEQDNPGGPQYRRDLELVQATVGRIGERLRAQIEKSWREHRFGTAPAPTLGYRRRFEQDLLASGFDQAKAAHLTEHFYGRMNNFLIEAVGLGQAEYASPDEVMTITETALRTEIERLPVEPPR